VSLKDLLCALVTVYLVVVLARALLSWFPIRPGTPVATISLLLRDLTEPVLAPLRRVIPPVGMLDMSAFVLIIGLGILRTAICS
jgi:YggT family protein